MARAGAFFLRCLSARGDGRMSVAVIGASLVAGIFVVLMLGVGLWWGMVRRARVVERPAAMAAKLSAYAMSGTKNPVFYEGDLSGRPWLLAGVTLTNQAGRQPANVRESVRLVLRVELEAEADIVVLRRHDRGQAGLDSFDSAFENKNAQYLRSDQRDAMLSFAREFEGGLRLRPRKDADKVLIPPGVWGSGAYILVHDRMTLDLAPAEIEAALAGMEKVARTLEGAP